jgi:AcrR family transcriptional regulator
VNADRWGRSRKAKKITPANTHVALYAHFKDKAALFDAAIAHWLADTANKLKIVRHSDLAPLAKIEAWFLTLHRLKHERALNDVELYTTYDMIAAHAKPIIAEHLAELHKQLLELIEEAELGADDPPVRAKLLMESMISFHHPKLVMDRAGENRERSFRSVLATVIRGLTQ